MPVWLCRGARHYVRLGILPLCYSEAPTFFVLGRGYRPLSSRYNPDGKRGTKNDHSRVWRPNIDLFRAVTSQTIVPHYAARQYPTPEYLLLYRHGLRDNEQRLLPRQSDVKKLFCLHQQYR